jgi:hypothetical protein
LADDGIKRTFEMVRRALISEGCVRPSDNMP